MANLFDSANYPTTEPVSVVVGDQWTWKRSDLTDYPPASYQLKYSLRPTSGAEVEIVAAGSGTDFLVEVSAAVTGAYASGWYTWQAYIIRLADSQRVTIGTGRIELRQNLDASSADPRTHARKTLEAIEAVMEGRATKEQESLAINGREIRLLSPEEIMKWRDVYRREVASEEAAARLATGGLNPRRLQVRFT